MKYLTYISLLIFSSTTYGFELPRFSNKDMNIHHIRMIRKAFVDFSKDIEQNNKYEEESFVKFKRFFLSNAYASNEKCFFGGWPSQMIDGVCKTPWKYGDDTWAENVQCKESKSSTSKKCNQVIDFSYDSCGMIGKFRCNPLLFGSDDKGNGKCVSTYGTYKRLTQKCVDQTKGTKELRESENFLKNNPDLLNQYVSSVEKFCKDTYREGEDFDHNYTCDALRERLNDINKDVVEDKKEVVEAQKVATKEANRALGILDRCQKDYDDSKDGSISKFFASGRGSLNQMVDYGKCSYEEVDTSISSNQLEKLLAQFDNVSNEVFPKKILHDSINAGVELGLKNLLFTMDQFDEDINIDKVLSKYPRLKRSPYKENIKKSLADFKRVKDSGELDKVKVDKDKIVKNLNNFSDKINSLCQKINTDYTKRIKSNNPSERIEEGTIFNSDSENAYYQSRQKELTEMYQDFLVSDKMNLSRLMATDHFKSDIFPFSNKLGERCAEGDIDNIAFTPVGREDIDDAMDDYKDLMLDELDDFNDIARSNHSGVEDGIHDLIKYRPYLLGNTLRSERADPDLQSLYATYLCKESLDVYSSDEMWRIGEVAAGGAGLIVSGALIATGIGSPLGVGLAATSGALVAAEGAMAVNSYIDADETADASSGSFATESITLDQHTKSNDDAQGKKNDALIAGGLALVQPLALLSRPAKSAAKGMVLYKETPKATKVKDVVDTPLLLKGKSPKASANKPKIEAKTSNEVTIAKRATSSTDVKKPANSSFARKARRDSKRTKQKEAPKAKAKTEKANTNSSQSRYSRRKARKERASTKDKTTQQEKPKESPKNENVSSRYNSKDDVSKYFLENHTMIKKLPSSAIKGLTFKSQAGVKNVLKQITGKDYASYTAKDLRKEIKRLSGVFHPDKYVGKNELFISVAKDEMIIINALKNAL